MSPTGNYCESLVSHYEVEIILKDTMEPLNYKVYNFESRKGRCFIDDKKLCGTNFEPVFENNMLEYKSENEYIDKFISFIK